MLGLVLECTQQVELKEFRVGIHLEVELQNLIDGLEWEGSSRIKDKSSKLYTSAIKWMLVLFTEMEVWRSCRSRRSSVFSLAVLCLRSLLGTPRRNFKKAVRLLERSIRAGHKELGTLNTSKRQPLKPG